MADISRGLLRDLRTDINAALIEVAAKHGVSINAANASYSSNEATFKLKISSLDSSGEVFNKGAKALEAFYPDYVGKVVKLNGNTTGKVVEYHSSKPKYPFIVEATNGKRYKLSEDMVAR